MVASLAAQDLNKEITLEKDYVPTEHKATRVNALPIVLKTSVPQKSLAYTDWAQAVNVPLDIPVMAPYGYKTKYEYSKKRGYFDLGAGSFVNVVGSAGYKFISTDKLTLKAWLQHTSTWNGKNTSEAWNLPAVERLKQQFNDNVVGVDLTNRLWNGTLALNTFYHFDHFNYFGGLSSKWDENHYKQTINEFSLKAGWTGAHHDNGLNYSAALRYNHFRYTHSLIDNLKPINENLFNLTASVETSMGSNMDFGLNIDGKLAYYTHPATMNYFTRDWLQTDNKTIGIVRLNPYISYREKMVNMLVGVNADISSEGVIARFSPNIKLDFNLIDGFTVYANAQGGKNLTLLSDMNAWNRYSAPMLRESVYSPVDAELGLRVGPFQGFYAKAFGGYGVFNNQQMPWLPEAFAQDPIPFAENDFYLATTVYRGLDLKGWRLGAEVGYQYKSYVDFSAALQYSDQDEDTGYAFGFDRPRYVADVKLKVMPIEKLSIIIGYQLRCDRAVYSHYIYDTTTPTITQWQKMDLANVNLLTAGASYQINDTFGVFAQGSNLLNKRWDDFYGQGAQKVGFLGGLSILF